jgi:hypothetical protein
MDRYATVGSEDRDPHGEVRQQKSRIKKIRLSLLEVPVKAKPPEGNTRER